MTNFSRAVGVFLFFIAIGAWLSWSSKDSPDFFVGNYVSGTRDPAAIRSSYDFSSLEGVALMQATKQRLVAEVQVLKEGSTLGVELGHFVVRDSQGSKAFACSKYSDVVLQFEGDGMAIAGEKPAMEVEGACEISADINRISPLWIPVAKILGEPAADGEFDFMDQHVKIRFSNVAEQWPRNWVLKSVRLLSQSGEILEINDNELRQFSEKPLILSF